MPLLLVRIAVYGLHIFGTKFKEEYGLCCCCTDCFVWHSFLGDVRPVTAGHLHLIFAQKKKKGVRLGLLSTFPDFEKKFAGGDKLYFSPFSVLYFAEEIIKISPLSDWFSPWGFFQG